jgi:hypothetical protein
MDPHHFGNLDPHPDPQQMRIHNTVSDHNSSEKEHGGKKKNDINTDYQYQYIYRYLSLVSPAQLLPDCRQED